MKKQLLPLLATVLFVSLCFTSSGQEQHPSQKSPKWLSNNGYWVVESNINTPRSSTIYFYTTNDVIVYKENVEGVKIRLNKTKTLMRLRKVLDESVTAWQQQHVTRENQMLVATAFKR